MTPAWGGQKRKEVGTREARSEYGVKPLCPGSRGDKAILNRKELIAR